MGLKDWFQNTQKPYSSGSGGFWIVRDKQAFFFDNNGQQVFLNAMAYDPKNPSIIYDCETSKSYERLDI